MHTALPCNRAEIIWHGHERPLSLLKYLFFLQPIDKAKDITQNSDIIMYLKTVRIIHKIFKEKGLTLSVAESCTGGLICHCLTALPGASSFLQAGVITYSAESKKTILGIRQESFDSFGIVSEETARQMADRIRCLTKTDIAVSTTGNLGPDVLEGKPKGLVYVAISSKKGTVSKEIQLKGTRLQVKEQAALAAMTLLIEVAENG